LRLPLLRELLCDNPGELRAERNVLTDDFV
jgi:hypothetical protein